MIFSTWVECRIICCSEHHIGNKGKVNIKALLHACSICMHIFVDGFLSLRSKFDISKILEAYYIV